MNAEHQSPGQNRRDRQTVLYRLEVGGPVDPGWAEWFEADTVTPVGENTLLEIRVADQAELYGRLRRIHNLNLKLISMVRIESEGPDGCRKDQRGLRNDPLNPNSEEESS